MLNATRRALNGKQIVIGDEWRGTGGISFFSALSCLALGGQNKIGGVMLENEEKCVLIVER
jgi:hypothetical protein